MNKNNTINSILKKLEETMPIIKEDDIVETMKNQYPNFDVPKNKRNIILNGVEMTMPYALSKDAKSLLKKDNSPLLEIYRDLDRGDILLIKSNGENRIIAENLSIKEEYRKPFEIEKLDVMKGNYNIIKRKSLDLLKTLEKLDIL